MSSLDFVMQNLQSRLGNPRNRCYANSAFRLWAWAGSFMGGAKLWNQTNAAVMAALTTDDLVHLPALEGLAPLWTQFNDQQQADASHFQQELVELAQTNQVITGYRLVDYSQKVHYKRAFPVHLIYLSLIHI